MRNVAMLRHLMHQSPKQIKSLSKQRGACPWPKWKRLLSSGSSTWTARDGALRSKDDFLDSQGLTVFDTLHEMQTRSCEVFSDRKLFGTYSEKTKQFEWMTFADFDYQVDKCRGVLKDVGVEPHTKIGIISNNRWEWAAIATAAYSLTANVVPMYEAQMAPDWTHILNDSSAKVLFCSNQDIFDRVQQQVLPSAPGVHTVMCLDAPEGEPHAFATALNRVEPDIQGKYVQAPLPEDLANLIYTSGTTSKPKGVELTHLNFTSNVKSAARSLVNNPDDFFRPDDCSLAFLPWAHSYGQTCELWIGMSHGVGMGICRGVPQILDDLQLVQPTLLFAVPTLFKKIYDGVHNLINTASPIRKRLMQAALVVGNKHCQAATGKRGSLGLLEQFQYKALDGLVLSKIRDRFGGRLRLGFVAGAACPREVLNFMDAIGITVCEGYGLTETSPIIALNTPDHRQVGCVGRPIGGVTVYIVDEEGQLMETGQEGEICCVGPNVMKGYYKNRAATDEAITTAPDGTSRMFHTGDLGCLDEQGYIKITGRLKEQYKLENGKYVVPTPIEEAISMSRFIHQVVVCGANRPYNVALIVPEWTTIRRELSIDVNISEEELVNDDCVRKLIDKEIEQACQYLKKFEIPQEWVPVSPFTAANNMLTPKMSIRRHKVISTYAAVISHLYGDDPVVAEGARSQGAKEYHSEAGQDDEGMEKRAA